HHDDGAADDVTLTTDAFNNRLNKASLLFRNVLRLPDIAGVEEVENLSTLAALANKINADEVAANRPNPQYQAFLAEGNDIGGIDSGFLVKASRVDVVDVTQVGKDSTYINPISNSPDLLNDRPSLVLRAAIKNPPATGYPVTVIVNHLRSLLTPDAPA